MTTTATKPLTPPAAFAAGVHHSIRGGARLPADVSPDGGAFPLQREQRAGADFPACESRRNRDGTGPWSHHASDRR